MSSGLFQGLAEPDIARIKSAAQRRRAANHGFFFHQGSPGTGLHLLAHGRVKMIQTTAEGHEVVVRIVGPGEMFGGVALLGEAVYPATAQTLEACEALVWSSAEFAQLVERYPALAVNALHVLARRLQEVQDRFRELATERVERRIARAVLRLARQAGRRDDEGIRIDMALTRQDLAQLTGTTLYTVSRVVRGWQERGLVKLGRTRIVVRKPHRLVAIAEDLPEHSGLGRAPRP